MKKKNIITRRQAIITGMSSLGGLLIGCSAEAPPTYGNILRMGDALTYHTQRGIMNGKSLAKEYDYRNISSFPATGNVNPAATGSEEFDKLLRSDFSDYRLTVEGSVQRPTSFSIDDLKKLSSRSQITRHTCEEGWTAIAQWTGVPLSVVLEKVGINPTARFINFSTFDHFDELNSIDLFDALHPQTILAYGMNGKDLPLQHGAPLRVRVETQLGYKSLKYIKKIVVSDHFIDLGDIGWAWYAGI